MTDQPTPPTAPPINFEELRARIQQAMEKEEEAATQAAQQTAKPSHKTDDDTAGRIAGKVPKPPSLNLPGWTVPSIIMALIGSATVLGAIAMMNSNDPIARQQNLLAQQAKEQSDALVRQQETNALLMSEIAKARQKQWTFCFGKCDGREGADPTQNIQGDRLQVSNLDPAATQPNLTVNYQPANPEVQPQTQQVANPVPIAQPQYDTDRYQRWFWYYRSLVPANIPRLFEEANTTNWRNPEACPDREQCMALQIVVPIAEGIQNPNAQ